MTTIDLNSELQFHDGAHLVAGFHGSLLKLRHCSTGDYSTVHITDVMRRLVEPRLRKTIDVRELDALPDAETAALEVYGAHIQEMVTGIPLGGNSTAVRPEYNPNLTTLNERVASKVTELTTLGMPASRATLMRKKKAFEDGGLAGLIDRRAHRKESPFDRADARIIETLAHVIAEETYDSSGNKGRLFRRLKEALIADYPGQNVPLPSESTLYRYIGYMTKGKYTTGNAQTRRTAANTPKRPFGTARRLRPGQEVQIDSSPWDILVRGEDGNPTRAILTIMVDVATRSIIAISVRAEATKGVDHAFLLAQCLVPRPLRPGKDELWRLTARRMPWADLVSEEERSRLDVTRPFIYPERIMMDNGADYRSKVFEAACRKFGVTLTYAAPHTPTDKAIVERSFHSIKTLFAQHLPGFKGGSVAERGSKIENKPLMDLPMLAELFEEWVTRVWQNRPHDSLRDPLYPTVKLSPNEMYNASFDVAAQLPLPLTADDYIDLMPIEYRVIGTAGIKINNRFYDSLELQPFRNTPSTHMSHSNQWEVRVNPYDPRIVWVRHPDGHWIECPWRDESTFQQPFVDTILHTAVEIAASRPAADNQQLKRAVADIHKSAAAAAKAVKKVKARNTTALVLANNEGAPMPQSAPLTAASPTFTPGVAADDDDTADIELGSFHDLNGTN